VTPPLRVRVFDVGAVEGKADRLVVGTPDLVHLEQAALTADHHVAVGGTGLGGRRARRLTTERNEALSTGERGLAADAKGCGVAPVAIDESATATPPDGDRQRIERLAQPSGPLSRLLRRRRFERSRALDRRQLAQPPTQPALSGCP
jgi:hypothetical protein